MAVEHLSIVDLEAVATDPEPGHWCPTCLLPSAGRFTVLFAHPRTLKVLARAVVDICADCSATTRVGEVWRIDRG